MNFGRTTCCRAVCLVLVAAVCACPWRCAGRVCAVTDCCAMRSIGDYEFHAHRSDLCCHAHSAQKLPERGSNRLPGDASCKGVCGGAVIQKPVQFQSLTRQCVARLDHDAPVASRLFETVAGDVPVLHAGAGNFGRSLRAVHASFLC